MYFTSIEAGPESRWARVQAWPCRGVNAVGAGMEAVLRCTHGALCEAAHTLNDGLRHGRWRQPHVLASRYLPSHLGISPIFFFLILGA